MFSFKQGITYNPFETNWAWSPESHQQVMFYSHWGYWWSPDRTLSLYPIGHGPFIHSDVVPLSDRTWSVYPIGYGPSIRSDRTCSLHPIGHGPSIRLDMVPLSDRTWSLFPIGHGPSFRSDLVPLSDRTWSLNPIGHGPSVQSDMVPLSDCTWSLCPICSCHWSLLMNNSDTRVELKIVDILPHCCSSIQYSWYKKAAHPFSCTFCYISTILTLTN